MPTSWRRYGAVDAGTMDEAEGQEAGARGFFVQAIESARGLPGGR